MQRYLFDDLHRLCHHHFLGDLIFQWFLGEKIVGLPRLGSKAECYTLSSGLN